MPKLLRRRESGLASIKWLLSKLHRHGLWLPIENLLTVSSRTLQSMFPNLDQEVIEDVVRAQEGNVGRAVDACLALSNG